MLLAQGFVFLLVQLLHALHRLESKRCGCVVQSEHVGGNVHEDMSCSWMSLGNSWKQTSEKRAEHTRKCIDRTTFFSNLHDAHPKREDTRQSDGDFESSLGIVEGGTHDVSKHARITNKTLNDGAYGSQHEECNPDII